MFVKQLGWCGKNMEHQLKELYNSKFAQLFQQKEKEDLTCYKFDGCRRKIHKKSVR